MRILLLSAYDAVSHRYWREGLVENFPEYEWHSLFLAPRYYSWRLRGNPLSWYSQAVADNEHILKQSFDLIIATSMVDMSTLRGLFPHLANTALCLFCHENQFAFPDNSDNNQKNHNNRLEAQMVFVYACLSADKVVFNSAWNQYSALQGIEKLFKCLPEKLAPDILTQIEKKSMLLSVPLQDRATGQKKEAVSTDFVSTDVLAAEPVKKPLTIVWNHRWEFDKGPQNLLAAIERFDRQGLVIKWHIIGQQFRQQPIEFELMRKIISDSSTMCLGQWGFIADKDQYFQVLSESDIVLSTSLHDFQGLAVLEAVQYGCVPLMPKRLVYPEIFSADYLYAELSEELNEELGEEREGGAENSDCAKWISANNSQSQREAQAITVKLSNWIEKGLPTTPNIDKFAWSKLKVAYAQLLESVLKK